MTAIEYNIIDKYLKDILDSGLNKTPKKIQTEMADIKQDPNEEWRIWFPIDSKVTDEEISELELVFGHGFPEDYKSFLKYKHFYELYIDQASFGEHAINIWTTTLKNMVLDGYPRELILDKGYIPFASWSDWGLLCFDTAKGIMNNYPVVLWDHDNEEEFQFFAKDFRSLIIHLDNEATKNSN